LLNGGKVTEVKTFGGTDIKKKKVKKPKEESKHYENQKIEKLRRQHKCARTTRVSENSSPGKQDVQKKQV